MLYLDTLASYPLLPEAREVLLKSCDIHYSNPSAGHDLGDSAKEAIENARSIIADSIEALPSEIVFTSGATESNNLIFKGHILRLLQSGAKPHVITSLIEHKCILEICQYLESQGCEITYIQPNVEGHIDLNVIRNAIQPNTELVSIMHVNNELGTVNDLKSIGKLCVEHGIKFHTDAAQGYLKLPINVDEMNLDYLSISAHKVGGPKGIG